MRGRPEPARDARILMAATEMAKEVGYRHITREEVARRAEVATGSVNSAYGTMAELRDAVMRRAVENGCAEIVAQGLADRSTIALNASPALKRRALATL